VGRLAEATVARSLFGQELYELGADATVHLIRPRLEQQPEQELDRLFARYVTT